MIRTYSELITIPTFEERYEYLRLNGRVGVETFGFDRWLNQEFYRHSPEWRSVRDEVIIRDCGCDLACEDRKIQEGQKIYVHHMNPINVDDIIHMSSYLLNPEYLITTVFNTHQAIHYGNQDLLIKNPVVRRPNDTCPWRR